MLPRGAFLITLLLVILLTRHAVTVDASPSPSPQINLSGAVSKIRETPGKLWNKTKRFLGISEESSTTPSPLSTKAPLIIVFVPKGPRRNENAATPVSQTTEAPVTSTQRPWTFSKIPKGVFEASNKLWNKAKKVMGYVVPTSTPKSPTNVLLVPVRFDVIGRAEPWVGDKVSERSCTARKGAHSGQSPCGAAAKSSSFSWWMVMLPLGGVAAAAMAAWLLLTRVRGVGIPRSFPWEKQQPATQKVTPTEQPGFRPPLALPPPTGPAPPVPTASPDALRVNSLYQPGVLATLHVYATPTVRPAGAAWAAGVSEHVHIYETPPK